LILCFLYAISSIKIDRVHMVMKSCNIETHWPQWQSISFFILPPITTSEWRISFWYDIHTSWIPRQLINYT
jgi:hypothetical protein